MRTRPRTTHLGSLRTFTKIRQCFFVKNYVFNVRNRAIVDYVAWSQSHADAAGARDVLSNKFDVCQPQTNVSTY